jgi:hypothetical protein
LAQTVKQIHNSLRSKEQASNDEAVFLALAALTLGRQVKVCSVFAVKRILETLCEESRRKEGSVKGMRKSLKQNIGWQQQNDDGVDSKDKRNEKSDEKKN